MNFQLLVKSLNLQVGASWMPTDSGDDFFPDTINWRDIRKYPTEYLEHREHRIFQVDSIQHIDESVPKKSGMLREAVWLHPSHRVLYLSILHRLLPKLDPRLSGEVYSYRCDHLDSPEEYQFNRRMERWKNFHNDFRRSALDSNTGAVLVTDLASYFDHIQIEQLGIQIESLLAGRMDDGDKEVVQFLLKLLKMWGHNGFGMPHNLDPSSFFGSVYLHNVDQAMIRRRYKYFRWLDDIRIVAKTKEQALRSLHDLQKELANIRLFLATDKTTIYEKGSEGFDRLMNVEDDILISEAEEKIGRGLKAELEEIVDRLFIRLEFHSSKEGDDRKFRAFANRLLDISDFVEVEKEIVEQIQNFVVPRLRTFPERTDYWTKMLLACPSPQVSGVLQDLLIERPSVFDWQRFYLWRLAMQLPRKFHPDGLIEKAREVCTSTISENVAAQSIVFLGKHSDNTERENLFATNFSAQRSYIVQRAVLIAVQETSSRENLYRRALETNSDHQQLVDYLLDREKPDYGTRARPKRHCSTKPRKVDHELLRGIGLTKSSGVTRYRLSRYDCGYE